MANDPELARKLLQVFCGGAGEQQTSVFGTMKNTTPEYSTDPDVLQGTNWPQGWQNAIAADDAPFLEDMNSFFYVISYLVKYLYQHGVAEWNNKETYTALKSVVFSNGKLYVAKQSTGADNPQDPATDSSNTYWYLALDPVNPPADQNWVIGYAQSLANLSQTIDSSTSKYPSNKAVQDALSGIDLSGYAKTDLSNITTTAKDVISNNAMPNYNRASRIGKGSYSADTDLILTWSGYGRSWKVAITVGGKLIAGGGNDRGDNNIGGGSNCFIPQGTAYSVEVYGVTLYKCPTKGV